MDRRHMGTGHMTDDTTMLPSMLLDLSADPAGNIVAPEAYLFGGLFGEAEECRCCCCTGECRGQLDDDAAPPTEPAFGPITVGQS